ncbi:transcriptional regulator [Pseudomonas sp. dw_358]|uniref:transcriptional regulator n=1 Tax=Pseudomonas sp. dw_358 TaxID=2720083 RepID=UPI001BD42B0C|nr:transcriptional regulator [Pseudomonas sp. dw_358]
MDTPKKYNWDLIERLLHEVQNGADRSFTPRPYAEQHAAAQAAQGSAVGDLDRLKADAGLYEKLLLERGFIDPRPEGDGGNGENFVLTLRGSSLLSLLDSSIPGNDHPRQVLDDQADALDPAIFDEVASQAQIAGGAV